MDYVFEYIKDEIAHWAAVKKEWEKELATLPPGTIVKKKAKNKNYLYHLYTEDGQQISKSLQNSEDSFVLKMIRKAYLEDALRSIEHNLSLMSKTISRSYAVECGSIWKTVSEAGYSQYLQNQYHNPKKLFETYGGNTPKVLEWLAQDDYLNMTPTHPENLKQITPNGVVVRSKSELHIATMLENEGIAYKYESVLQIGKVIYRPDIVFLRPSDLKLIYWEHLGLSHIDDYHYNSIKKLNDYRKKNITLWDNLILTYDTPDGGLDARLIRGIFGLMVLV